MGISAPAMYIRLRRLNPIFPAAGDALVPATSRPIRLCAPFSFALAFWRFYRVSEVISNKPRLFLSPFLHLKWGDVAAGQGVRPGALALPAGQ